MAILFFDIIDITYSKCHRILLNRGGLYKDYRDWIKNKIATVNTNNNVDNCFQYAVTVALNEKQINNNSERIPRLNLFQTSSIGKKKFSRHTKNIGKCLN